MPMFDYKFYNYNKKHYLDLLLELKDGTLSEILPKLSKKQTLSMCIQVIYTLKLMHGAGYYHTDLHNKNIAYTKVNKDKMILLDNIKIPSYGYQFSFIDYGLILHKSFILNKKEKKKIIRYKTYNWDLNNFIIKALLHIKYAKNAKTKKREEFMSFFYQNYKSLFERISLIIKTNFDKIKSDKMLYYMTIIYVGIYNKNILKEFFRKSDLDQKIDSNIIEFIELNINDYDKILNYLILKN
jgi:hypothetical protein